MSMTALLIATLGLGLGVAAHAGAHATEQQARARYHEIMGEHKAEVLGDDIWEDIRHYAGGWGCLTIFLRFLRGLGILLVLGATLYTLLSM